jgi:hypothetical protein
MRTLVALAALAVAPATAAAAGFPMPGMDTTQTGATAPGNPYRFVAFPGRGNSTLLVKINRDDGRPQRHRVIAGAQTVAPVAQDGSTTGLSADGSTLVLASVRHRFPQRVSHFVLVTTANLAPERRITLRGDFSLDGVAPDGQRLYLTRYGGNDPLNYAVRVYDVAHRRLLPKPLVDPRNPTEKMVGFPVTRALSPDGRWAYTLYGGGEEQFVHALDLTGGRAFCIDLEGLSFDDVSSMHLRAQGGRIDLLNQAGGTVRRINASTFAVTTPKQHPIDLGPAAHDDAAPSDGFPWGLAAAVAAVGAGALVLLRRRYAAGTDSATSRSDSSSSPTVP